MNTDQVNKFIDWYKRQDEFKNLPEEEKPITLAFMIKKFMNVEIKK
jgi:hypothetical protein